MIFPNPIDKRLDFVRKQYGQKAYEKTREIVAANLGIAESEIAPGQQVNWEKFIPWLGKQVHKLLKQGPRAASELKRLERGFQASIEPFLVKKKGRKADIERLSPKRARQFAGRQQRALGEAKDEQAKKLGYKEVARLGNGYTAVVAVIDPDAPSVQKYLERIKKRPPTERFSAEKHPAVIGLKEWVAKHASFQQWLGVELGNCLQFYKVNYQPHGEGQFNIQRGGGKLYGILGPKGKPVAAILTGKDGSIRETNGPGNRPPPEKDQEYVDRFVQKHLKQDAKEDTAFHPPEGFPDQSSRAIDYFLDYWTERDIPGRRRFLRKAQGYARQQGADFSKVWPRLAIYILEESKYSALASVKKANYPKKAEVVSVIKRAADLYRKSGSIARFTVADTAGKVAAEAAQASAQASAKTGPAAAAAGEALKAAAAQDAAAAAWAAQEAAEAAAAGSGAAAAGSGAVAAAWALKEAAAAGSGAVRSRNDYAQKLLELMRDAARAAGGAQPRRAGNPTGARALVKDCQATWESYCEKPGKTRLKKVFVCLRRMEKSKATTVKSERSRCLRSARAEDRKHKHGIC